MIQLLKRLRAIFGGSEPHGGGAAEVEDPTVTTDRRRRDPTPSERQIAESIGQKVLHGWLQNRRQTLMPLSVNLARLQRADAERIIRVAAVATLAGDDDLAPERMAAWLPSVGADEVAVVAFREALTRPPALHQAISDVKTPELAALALVVTLVATREAGPAGKRFADYVASRLSLPSAAIRSAERRYRA